MRWEVMLVAAAAIIVGTLAVEVPRAATAVVLVLALGGPVLVVGTAWMRRLVQRLHMRLACVRPLIEQTHVERFRLARGLYYAGMATVGLLQLRYRGTTLSDLLFLAALLVAAVDAFTLRGFVQPRLPVALFAGVGFVAVGALVATFTASNDPNASLAILARVVYLLVAWFWLGTVVLRTPANVRTAAWCFVGSAAFCGAWAIGQKTGHLPFTANVSGRVSGLTEHVNELGSLTAIAIVPALMLTRTSRRKIVGFLAVGAIAAGLLLSGSIGAALAAVCALLVGVVSRDVARATLTVAVLSGVVLIYAATSGGFGSSQFVRVSTATNASTGYGGATLFTRIETYKGAWLHIRADPLNGVGLDTASDEIYSLRSGSNHEVHNLFLGLWYEAGLFGLLGITILVWTFLSSAWRAVISAVDTEEQMLAISLLASVVAFLVVAMSEPMLNKRYALATVALAMPLAVRRSARVPVLRPARTAVHLGQADLADAPVTKWFPADGRPRAASSCD